MNKQSIKSIVLLSATSGYSGIRFEQERQNALHNDKPITQPQGSLVLTVGTDADLDTQSGDRSVITSLITMLIQMDFNYEY